MQPLSPCRNSACAAPLESDWAFCPVCGTAASGLVPSGELTVILPPHTEGEYSVEIRGTGPRPVRARVEWLDLPPGFEPLPVRSDADATVIRFRLEEGFPCRPQTLLAALISADGPRESRWGLHRERRTGLRVRLEPEAPGRLECNEQAVVLRWDRPPRELHLRNAGGRPLHLKRVDAPPGVLVSDLADAPLDDVNLPQWALAPGKETLVRLKLAGSTPGQVEIQPTEGAPVKVDLFLPDAPRGGFQPRFIVGVDIGTENASVCCRDLTEGSVFAVPLEGAATRIPCYMAFNDAGSEEPAVYGKSAVDRLVLNRGIVVRDLKIHLRHGRQLYAQAYGDHFRTENLLYHLIAHLKHEVERFLEARAGAVTSTRWCFTLPVLQDPAAYETLRRKYRAILKRVFLTEIRDGRIDPDETFAFLTEPEAAALYVFQRLGQDVPALLPRPFRDGDVVCVLDAGAGTTDVALMRMRIQDGEQTFEILGETGTDLPTADALQAEDFGGRGADLSLVECLARGSLKGGHATPENVARQMNMILGQGTTDPARARNRALQSAMEAKHLLCGGDPKVDVRAAWPDLDRTIPGEVTLKRFHVTIGPALDRILSRMEDLIARCGLTRREVGWVFAIGGSSNIPLVEERLQQLFPGRVIPLEAHRDVRMEAVARGAVWSWRARLTNVAPLDVALQVRRGGDIQRQSVLFRDRPLTTQNQEFHFELVDQADVELIGVKDGAAWRLTGLTVESPREPRDLAITVKSADGALHLEARVNGTARIAPPAWLA